MCTNIRMEIFIKENMQIILNQDMGNLFYLIMTNTKESGNMALNKGEENTIIIMEIVTLDNFIKIKRTEKDNIHL